MMKIFKYEKSVIWSLYLCNQAFYLFIYFFFVPVPGDVVVHIFLPEQRALYNLEEFYANAPLIDLPFENQPPFRG